MADSKMELFKPQPFTPKNNQIKTDWQEWKDKFLFYLRMCEEHLKFTEKEKAYLLLNLMGTEAVVAMEKVHFNNINDKENMDILLMKFNSIYDPSKNEAAERFKFFSRRKHEQESIEDYVANLKAIANKCNFNNKVDNFIIDMIIINSEQYMRDLIFLQEVNLPQVIQLYKQNVRKNKKIEDIIKNISINLKSDNSMPVKQSKSSEDSKLNDKHQDVLNISAVHTETTNRHICYRCGTNHPYKQCPAYNEQCSKCFERGHFTSRCKLNEEAKNTDDISKETVKEVKQSSIKFPECLWCGSSHPQGRCNHDSNCQGCTLFPHNIFTCCKSFPHSKSCYHTSHNIYLASEYNMHAENVNFDNSLCTSSIQTNPGVDKEEFCWRCGKYHGSICSADGYYCRKCKQHGHFPIRCGTRPDKKKNEQGIAASESRFNTLSKIKESNVEQQGFCWLCGKAHGAKCPADGNYCYKCKQYNHYPSQCHLLPYRENISIANGSTLTTTETVFRNEVHASKTEQYCWRCGKHHGSICLADGYYCRKCKQHGHFPIQCDLKPDTSKNEKRAITTFENRLNRESNIEKQKFCWRCGETHGDKCSADGTYCQICKQYNHFFTQCPLQSGSKNNSITVGPTLTSTKSVTKDAVDTSKTAQLCWRCGKGHNDKCSADGTYCDKCKQYNHFPTQCHLQPSRKHDSNAGGLSLTSTKPVTKDTVHTSKTERFCWRCGKAHNDKCSAHGTYCDKCKQYNHFPTQCHLQPTRKRNSITGGPTLTSTKTVTKDAVHTSKTAQFCWRCGKPHNDKCSADGTYCDKCKQYNHFPTQCHLQPSRKHDSNAGGLSLTSTKPVTKDTVHTSKTERFCWRCGKAHNDKCSAHGTYCDKCKQYNHFPTQCHLQPTRKRNSITGGPTLTSTKTVTKDAVHTSKTAQFCWRCGKPHNDKCSADGTYCDKCKQYNHFPTQCHLQPGRKDDSNVGGLSLTSTKPVTKDTVHTSKTERFCWRCGKAHNDKCSADGTYCDKCKQYNHFPTQCHLQPTRKRNSITGGPTLTSTKTVTKDAVHTSKTAQFCWRCGKSHNDKCSADGTYCDKCKQYNHFPTQCHLQPGRKDGSNVGGLSLTSTKTVTKDTVLTSKTERFCWCCGKTHSDKCSAHGTYCDKCKQYNHFPTQCHLQPVRKDDSNVGGPTLTSTKTVTKDAVHTSKTAQFCWRCGKSHNDKCSADGTYCDKCKQYNHFPTQCHLQPTRKRNSITGGPTLTSTKTVTKDAVHTYKTAQFCWHCGKSHNDKCSADGTYCDKCKQYNHFPTQCHLQSSRKNDTNAGGPILLSTKTVTKDTVYTSKTEQFCWRCGKTHSDKCSADGAYCDKCKQYNHFSTQCYRQPSRKNDSNAGGPILLSTKTVTKDTVYTSKTEQFCWRCGKTHSDKCSADGAYCDKCKQYNHFSTQCYRQPSRKNDSNAGGPILTSSKTVTKDSVYTSKTEQFCWRCGKTHTDKCSADGTYCDKCKQYNHFPILCFLQPGRKSISIVADPTPSSTKIVPRDDVQTSKTEQFCSRCGKSHSSKCPADGNYCYKCKEFDHLPSQCFLQVVNPSKAKTDTLIPAKKEICTIQYPKIEIFHEFDRTESRLHCTKCYQHGHNWSSECEGRKNNAKSKSKNKCLIS